MKELLGYIIFGLGWPILILSSIWVFKNISTQMKLVKNYITIVFLAFYTLGYTATVYWLGKDWIVGVLPAFVVFLILLIWVIKLVKNEG
jgi:hypothetical protein